MSKKEEILHKLSTEDRNYIKKKFKEREEFCIGQVESLTNLINVLIEVNKEMIDEKFDLESKLAESENFYKDLGFKDEKDARDYLIDCITQPKDLVEDVRQLKQQLAESEEKYNDTKELGTEQFYSLTEMLKSSQEEIDKLKQQLTEKEEYIKYNVPKFIEANEMMSKQLAEKEAEVQSWKDGTMVVKLGKLEEQLAEKEKECAVWERAYEYAIFECDFYKNHTQTTNEETMKRIEQLYEKILKRAKLLMEDK